MATRDIGYEGPRGSALLVCSKSKSGDPKLSEPGAVGGAASAHRWRDSDTWFDCGSVCLPVPMGYSFRTESADSVSGGATRFAFAATKLEFGDWQAAFPAGPGVAEQIRTLGGVGRVPVRLGSCRAARRPQCRRGAGRRPAPGGSLRALVGTHRQPYARRELLHSGAEGQQIQRQPAAQCWRASGQGLVVADRQQRLASGRPGRVQFEHRVARLHRRHLERLHQHR